jgi:hypothetical protein
MHNIKTIAVIGTAGRYEDGDKLSIQKYEEMNSIVEKLAAKLQKESNSVVLVSGGAAWADHVAVNVFNKGLASKLRLHLPCAFDASVPEFEDAGVEDWMTNPGRISNLYHRKFSQKIGQDSLKQISDAIDLGAEIVIGGGFHERNTRIAKDATHLIAFTFGSGDTLKDGGTADTLGKYLKLRKKFNQPNDSFHVDLNIMKIHKEAKVKS